MRFEAIVIPEIRLDDEAFRLTDEEILADLLFPAPLDKNVPQ